MRGEEIERRNENGAGNCENRRKALALRHLQAAARGRQATAAYERQKAENCENELMAATKASGAVTGGLVKSGRLRQAAPAKTKGGGEDVGGSIRKPISAAWRWRAKM